MYGIHRHLTTARQKKIIICPVCNGRGERVDAKTKFVRKCVACDNGVVKTKSSQSA